MVDVVLARAQAASLVDYACGRYTGGRDENDPVYQTVTEGRDVGAARKTYSNCYELAHWLLFLLGSRAKFVNRTETRGWARLGRTYARVLAESESNGELAVIDKSVLDDAEEYNARYASADDTRVA